MIMTSTNRKEKRSDPRIPADLRLRTAEGDGLIEMQVANVSLGGAYCRSPHPIEPMTRMEVILELPSEDGVTPVRTEAVVVRAERSSAGPQDPTYHLALWFQGMSEEHRTSLMRYLGTYEH
jgi:hypothetical protein